MWRPISTAPFDRDLELAVIDSSGPHALVFPCRRLLGGWINAVSKIRIEVQPTHWREWNNDD
ncbi:MAG TPA: hypothetical protein VEF90_10630 [Xanthobacteraceae bacterium]|nr:hypothetical protein [Xanthobacteraceae bacterium]